MKTKLIARAPFRAGTLPAQRAAAVWQLLFNLYREQGCKLDNMHDMLVDYLSIREVADTLHGSGTNFVFLWSCSPGTHITEYRPKLRWLNVDPKTTIYCYNIPSDYVVKVTYSDHEVVVEEVDLEELFREAEDVSTKA